MKQVAGILALVIGTLIMQPLFAALGLPPAYEACPNTRAENKCASKKACDRPEKPCNNKKGETKGCNPLLGCSSGNFYIHSYSTVSLDYFAGSKVKASLVNDNRTLKQPNECWHPPEVV